MGALADLNPTRENQVPSGENQVPTRIGPFSIDPWIRSHASFVFALAVLPAAVMLQVYRLLETQPGFYEDESSIAYNAYTIATSGVDEHGVAWPLYFHAFAGPSGDFKSAPFIYLLAGFFKLFGPSILGARLLSAGLGLLAAFGLGWLAARTSKRPVLGLIVAATALLTPHLFELSRLVFEVSIVPAELVLFLLVLQSSPADRRWSWVRVIGLGLLLALMAYSYTGMRYLAPLLALGLLFWYRRPTWTNVASTWGVFVLALLPLAVYAMANPTMLTGRIDEAGYFRGASLPDIVARFANQYFGNLDPRNLLLIGDRIQRHHIEGAGGPILVATLVLAIIGVDRIVHRFGGDPWWRFVVYGTLVAAVPASLTTDVSHTLRLVALPVFLIVLTIPALAWLLEAGAGRWPWRQGFGALLVAATLVQGVYFQVRFQQIAPGRIGWFDGEFPQIFNEALATGADPIYLVDGVAPPYIHAYWYGVLRGIPTSRFVHLTGTQIPPSGATVLSGESACNGCVMLSARGFFKLYIAP